MTLFDICFLSIALSMDCFTISIVSGVIMRRCIWRVVLRMSILFGLFQAFMPFLGWLATSHFRQYLTSVDHWIAFGLLAFLGGKMIKESFDEGDTHHFNPCRLRTQLMLALATSIDALAVGISLACLGYNDVSQLVMPLSVIGLFSFAFGVTGSLLGAKFGNAIAKKLKPELFGGIILILIGLKILWIHCIEKSA